jgi:hypothetical protein
MPAAAAELLFEIPAAYALAFPLSCRISGDWHAAST